MRQRRPVAYQEQAGKQEPVVCRYLLAPDLRVRLEIGAYDRARPLVIDPTLVFSTFFGGSGDGRVIASGEEAFAVAVDAAGDIYIAGVTSSRNLPVRNALQPEPGAASDCVGDRCTDIFVAKLNANGLIYSTYLGGSADEAAYDLAVDAAGSVYLTGYTQSAHFPTTSGAPQLFNRGFADAFALKLAPSGATLVYSTYLGGAGPDYGNGLVVDKDGYAYVTGSTRSSDFPLADPFHARIGGDGFYSDAFVTKLNPLGTTLVYSTYLGGNGPDGGNAIALDNAGNIYLTGATISYDFPTRRALQPYYVPGYDFDYGLLPDAFITKLDATGRTLVFSTYLGSYGSDAGNAIAVDAAGNVYVAGFTGANHSATDFPFVNPLPLAARLRPNPYATTGVVVKLSPDGARLLYSTPLGGVGYGDQLNDLVVDAAGRIYVIGTAGADYDFPLTLDALSPELGRYTRQASLSVLDPNRSGLDALRYSTLFGGDGDEAGNGLAVDARGHIYLTGRTTFYLNTTRTNNLPVVRPLQDYGPTSDAFVAQIAPTLDNAADPIPPIISITSPTTAGSFTTTEGAIDLAGTASDNAGVTVVQWSSDRVGAG